jgi:hypothetical protein
VEHFGVHELLPLGDIAQYCLVSEQLRPHLRIPPVQQVQAHSKTF